VGFSPSDETGAVKVLLVEDDARIAAAVRRGLEAEGFAVEVADDGDVGLWTALNGGFDVIVLDLMLPTRNGFRVCADLRAAGDCTPILVLTAKDGELDETEALDTGADDFLSKPFSFVVLLARLRALIRRGAPPRPAVLSVGSLELDPGARRCRRHDTDIRLTAREFALLEYLVRKDGNVASKAEILDHVWGIDFAGDPNVVEVYVGYLRKKVDAAEPHLIHTVRGVGYVLRAPR
jgi:two-component system OmpR family response regulator